MKKEKDDFAKSFKELMEMYDLFRANWFKTFGNYDGFDTWFTGQLLKKESANV